MRHYAKEALAGAFADFIFYFIPLSETTPSGA